MFIILSHTCSRISYITDCTLKKDNNQVNPLLPRHIPRLKPQIFIIFLVCIPIIGFGDRYYMLSDMEAVSFSAPVTRSIFTIEAPDDAAKMYRRSSCFSEVTQPTSGFLFFSNSSNKSSPLFKYPNF